jgi:hypothetical protein
MRDKARARRRSTNFATYLDQTENGVELLTVESLSIEFNQRTNDLRRDARVFADELPLERRAMDSCR